MRISYTYTVEEVAQACRRAGIEIVSTSPWSHHEDGEVQLDSDIHIQVGEGYLAVMCAVGSCFRDAGEINTIEEAIAAYHSFKEN